MVVPEASINNIMGGLENTAGVRLHNHRRKLKQRFDIVRKLGQGTYGKVQLGINKETGQEVAIKTIKKCKIETEADLIRIRREIQIMSSVQHPNIIHIYEVFENREKMVLVMEYAAGGELYDYLSEKKVLTEDEARRIFRQIATAIYYCHKHKICHRDLKLENVLLDEHGSAKIADFGLSNVFDDCRLLGTFCGSPLYASPEIVKGTPYHGPEVDCWSLGVLLYTLVYGAMPFDGSNFKRLVRQISQGDYFEPKKPSPASPLIREMLNVNPSRRADITAICSHWWVDEGQPASCLDIAEELANQTPVRLDLLLSLAPPAVSNDKLLIPDQGATVEGGSPTSADRPLRSQSLGSLATTAPLDFIPELPVAQQEQEPNKSSAETTERRKKERSRSRRRDRSSSRSRKHDKQEDSTSDVSLSETKPHRKSSKGSRKKLEESDSKKKSPDVSVTLNKMDVEDSKENIVQENVETINEDMEVVLTDKKEIIVEKEKVKVEEEDKNNEMIVVAEKIDEEKLIEKTDKVETVKSIDNKSEHQEKEKGKIEEKAQGNAEIKVEKIEERTKDDIKESDDVKKMKKVKTKTDVSAKDKIKEEMKDKDEIKKKPDEDEKIIDEDKPSKPIERRKSKIFETAEKFNNIQNQQEIVKPPPKKVFLPGVKVSDAKKAYERKSSLASSSSFVKPGLLRRNSSTEPTSPNSEFDRKFSLASTVALNKLVEDVEKLSKEEDEKEKKIITEKKEDTEIEVPTDENQAADEIKTESIPEKSKLTDDEDKNRAKTIVQNAVQVASGAVSDNAAEKKAVTLPRRKTSRAEIKLATPKPVKPEFRSEVEHMVSAPQTTPYQQRSEVIFPVAAVVDHRNTPPPPTPVHTSSQPQLVHKPPPIVKQDSQPREHIIPIQFEHDAQPPKPQPVVQQRSISRNNSQSLSRQSTLDSDSGSVTSQGEPIRKSPREVIIPIAVEGGGYVTPSVDAVTRMSSLNESEDELSSRGFGLHSARRPKKQLETADSISSDEDDDNFEILTAENLFSTLLSRVRNLTHRLNSEENRSTAFPRLFNHHHSLFENSPSRRLSEARSFNRNDIPWRRSMSRDGSSSTLPRDFSGRSTIHRTSSQKSDSNTKIPQRSTSFRTSSEKPPPYRSKYLRSLSENVNKDETKISPQRTELSNISENFLRESVPKDDSKMNTISTRSDDKLSLSSNSDLSESYKTAKNSQSESVDVMNSNKCSETLQKKNEMKTTNSYSDLSEISQSSDSKSLSKSTDENNINLNKKKYDTSPRNSSLLSTNPINSYSESRISSLNSTIPKFRRSSLLENITNRNRNNNSELEKIRTDFRSQSSSPLNIIKRRSSFIDDVHHNNTLKYSTLNPSRSSNLSTSSLRRLSRDSSSFFGSSLSDRISSEDIEKFRNEFKRGFRVTDSPNKSKESFDYSNNDSNSAKINNPHENENKSQTNILPDEQMIKENDQQNMDNNSFASAIINNNKNIISEDNVKDSQNSTPTTQQYQQYIKPKCPSPYQTSGYIYPPSVSMHYNRPKSFYSLNANDVNSNYSSCSGIIDKKPSCMSDNKLNTSKIPNYRRTSSLSYNEKPNNMKSVTKERKHSHNSITPDRSVLGKFFEKSNNNNNNNSKNDDFKSQKIRDQDEINNVNDVIKQEFDNDNEDEKNIKTRKTHRISRFLRPDFYDTPLEESTYVKKKIKSPASMSTLPSSSKSEKKRSSRVDSTIRALRESSLGPKECDIIDRESTLIKRAVSLDDVSNVPKKYKAKRSASVNYEKNAEAVKTIQKFIKKTKSMTKKSDEKKTEIFSNCNNNNNNSKCDKDIENDVTKKEDSPIKKSIKTFNSNSCMDNLQGPSRKYSVYSSDISPNYNNFNSITNSNYKTENLTEDYSMKKCNSLESNQQTRLLKIAGLEKLEFSRPYRSADSTPSCDEIYDNNFDDNSLLLLSPNDDNSDSYSATSDYLDARDFITSTSPTTLANPGNEESVSERIRRKSFYSRFNQLKKKKTPPSQVQNNLNIGASISRSRLPTYRRSFTSADYSDINSALNNNNNSSINPSSSSTNVNVNDNKK
ncbi:nuak family kinase 1 [Lycorma delicatula]|uniref:nuak family kinase 1 n=1 Tax=Lycorma delicatula TaxID=130591 RepID=UPI003F50F847